MPTNPSDDIAACARAIVDNFPPLTEDQRCRITALLRDGGMEVGEARRKDIGEQTTPGEVA